VVGLRKEPYHCRNSSKVPEHADYCAHVKPEAVYVYTDEEGRELYRVIRFPGKRFKTEYPAASRVREVPT
jgi:hypothetical protein